MRLPLLGLALSAATLASPAATRAQTLAQRVERAPAGQDVTFQVPALPDVCGYGDAIIRFRDGHARGYTVMWHRGDRDDLDGLDRETLRARCERGPVQVTLERDGRTVRQVRARVAANPPAGTTSIGATSTAEAADYLIGTVARNAPRRVAGQAMALFTITDGESWQPLLTLARDRAVDDDVRKQAVFWLGQAASRRAVGGLENILADDDQELEIRKAAVFALSQHRSEAGVDVLMDLAQTAKEPEIRRNALFWLGQKADDDPRVLALFERILLGKS